MGFHINTVNTKKAQLANGTFSMGNGPVTMLVVGSCRSVPYLNYFHYLNAGAKYTIHFVDPFNFHYDQQDRIIDLEKSLLSRETDARILDVLKRTKVFVHEYYAHFGLFNVNREQPKHIYQFGLAPETDICIPNFHDIFVLFNDFVRFDSAVRKMFIDRASMGMPPDDGMIQSVADMGRANIEKFYGVCRKSSFPEMADVFNEAWRVRRMFWNNNHVSALFTMSIFAMLNSKFLNLDTPKAFWERIGMEDMYANPHTSMTAYDRDAYGLKWPENPVPLAL